jgi:hypothetical protein
MSTGDRALGGQLATCRVRKGQETDLRRARMFQHMRDERHLDVPPGTDVGRLDMSYNPPAILNPALRRREAAGRSAI